MSLGTLYYKPASPRGLWLIPYAKFLGLEINSKLKDEAPEFDDIFPLKKVPGFITSDGLVITETIAIGAYFAEKSGKLETLGKTPEDKAMNLKWFSFMNSDISQAFMGAFYSAEESVKKEHWETLNTYVKYMDDRLKESKYLVSNDTVHMCDLFIYSTFSAMPKYGVNLDEYQHLLRYVEDVKNHPGAVKL